MKSFFLATLLAVALWLPAQAAEPATTGPDTITFAQYRDWRLNFIVERQKQIAARLAASGLSDTERERLEREKAYYDRQAAMPPDQRDHLFRSRFDQIDTSHDGIIDRAERTAWREKEHARYRHAATTTGTGH